jgi:hypothetical protein
MRGLPHLGLQVHGAIIFLGCYNLVVAILGFVACGRRDVRAATGFTVRPRPGGATYRRCRSSPTPHVFRCVCVARHDRLGYCGRLATVADVGGRCCR